MILYSGFIYIYIYIINLLGIEKTYYSQMPNHIHGLDLAAKCYS